MLYLQTPDASWFITKKGRKLAQAPGREGTLLASSGTWAMDKLGRLVWGSMGLWGHLDDLSKSESPWVLFPAPQAGGDECVYYFLTWPITPLRKLTQSGGWSLWREPADCWLCWGLEHSLSFEKSRGKPCLWVILNPRTHMVESQAAVGRARRYSAWNTLDYTLHIPISTTDKGKCCYFESPGVWMNYLASLSLRCHICPVEIKINKYIRQV